MNILGNAVNSIVGLRGPNSAQDMQAIQNAPYPTPGGLYPPGVDNRDVYYPTQGELRFQIKPVENGYLVIVTTGKSVSTYIAAEFKDVHDIIDLAAVKSKLNASG